MKKMRVKIFILGFLFLFPWGSIGMAEDFPQKPIRVMIPFAAGGGATASLTAFQPSFEKVLGQRILIDYKPGGSTKIGTMEVMNAKPDGYTLLFHSAENLIAYYSFKAFGAYEDRKFWEELVPIGNIMCDPWVFVIVRSDSPFKTYADLVKAAKENPGKQLSGAGPVGGGMHELMLNQMSKSAGVNFRYVPFSGSGPGKVALLGGHVDFQISTMADLVDIIKSGQARGLVISTEKRLEAIPDVPTFKELGIIREALAMSRALWGPPKLPSNLVNTITKMIEKATKDPEFIKIAQNQLMAIVAYRRPEEMKVVNQKFLAEFGPKMAEMYKPQ